MYGKLIDKAHILATEMLIPDNSISHTDGVYIGDNDNRLELRIYANTKVNIVETDVTQICIETCDDDKDYTDPQGKVPCMIICKTEENHSSTSYGKGQLLYAGGISKAFLGKYLRLRIETKQIANSEKIDAFVCTVG